MFHVKHFLEKTLKELNIETDDKKTEKCLLYLEELLKWNKKINLISRKLKREEVFKKLFLPSLLPYKIINKGEKILDFGAGGGISSVPLKIFKPNMYLHLLESKQKNAVFLEHISFLLNLDLKIINKFVQTKEEMEERYDWIFARAVNPEQIPSGLANKILYHGEYTGNKFICEKKLVFREHSVSVLTTL